MSKVVTKIITHNVRSNMPCLNECPFRVEINGAETVVLNKDRTTAVTLCSCANDSMVENNVCYLNKIHKVPTNSSFKGFDFGIKIVDIPVEKITAYNVITEGVLKDVVGDDLVRADIRVSSYAPMVTEFLQTNEPKGTYDVFPLTFKDMGILYEYVNSYNKALVEVTKDIMVESCHKLYDYDGKCKNLHGHSYRISVTVRSTRDKDGFVLDFKKLKQFLNLEVDKVIDHTLLNDSLPIKNTTAENMSVLFFYMAKDFFKNLDKKDFSIVSVKVWETTTSYAEFKGENI